MAYRDLTHRFKTSRINCKSRLKASKLHTLNETGLYLNLLKSKSKPRGLEKSLLADNYSPEDGLEMRMIHQPPEWIRFADEANESVRLLHIKLEYLQLLHTRRLMIRFDDTEEMDDKEINQITEEIGDLFQRVDRSLKRITNPFIGGEPVKSTADRNVRMNTQRSIAIRVQELSGRFRKSQREYMHRLQLQKYGSDMFPIFDEEEINGTGSSGFVSSQREKILMDMRNFEVDSRDKEIQRIAKSVVALSTVFKEVAEMVIDQGTVIDRIDYNIEQVATRTRNALKELHKAEKFQKNTRPERCIFTLLALIGICFLILVFKHSR